MDIMRFLQNKHNNLVVLFILKANTAFTVIDRIKVKGIFPILITQLLHN